jgi:hypothetical protein
LIRLAKSVQKGTPEENCPVKAKKFQLKGTTSEAPFKQMENIQTFVSFCEAYGVPKTGLFQTVDLYEGRNMSQVISCIQQLGSESQRNGFNGPTIGPRPTERNVREFSDEQLRAGQTIIGLQAGTNKCATQSGMRMGGVRHVADIRADDLSKEGASVIGLQMGTNKGATQSGMTMGGVRHVADIRADDLVKEGATVIGLQAGYNKGATQSGMTMGGVRHVADIRADDLSKEGAGFIGLQMGSNKGATQTGMRAMGGQRHVVDIRADQMDKASQGIINLQYGSAAGATQSGMSMGGRRDINIIPSSD